MTYLNGGGGEKILHRRTIKHVEHEIVTHEKLFEYKIPSSMKIV